MQKSNALMLHKSAGIFKTFCYDMEILPSYTPLFLIDLQGKIVEKRRFNVSEDDFSNIVSITAASDRKLLAESMRLYDVYVLEALFGNGKDFFVVSKDKHGFSRCVVVSCSDENCTKLHEYFEKLSCYKDYIDSFSSLSFNANAKTPALRIFRSRLNGASELLRLSENGGTGRTLAFPLRLALEKLSRFVVSSQDFSDFSIITEGIPENTAVRTSENFFKLTASLLGFLMRQSKSGTVKIRMQQMGGKSGAHICFSTNSDGFENKMLKNALVKAFRRSEIDVYTAEDNGESMFCITVEYVHEAGMLLSDVETVMHEIDEMMADESFSDLYCMSADI